MDLEDLNVLFPPTMFNFGGKLIITDETVLSLLNVSLFVTEDRLISDRQRKRLGVKHSQPVSISDNFVLFKMYNSAACKVLEELRK